MVSGGQTDRRLCWTVVISVSSITLVCTFLDGIQCCSNMLLQPTLSGIHYSQRPSVHGWSESLFGFRVQALLWVHAGQTNCCLVVSGLWCPLSPTYLVLFSHCLSEVPKQYAPVFKSSWLSRTWKLLLKSNYECQTLGKKSACYCWYGTTHELWYVELVC